MQSKIFCSLLLSIGFIFSQAQDPSTNIKLLKLSDAYLLPGVSFSQSFPTSLNRFRELAPQSQLLQADFSEYNQNDFVTTNGHSQFDLMVGFQLANRKAGTYRENLQLRVGLSYSSRTLLNNFLYREEVSPYDTLRSSRTGQEYYIDSVFSSNYNMDYLVDYLSLNVALLWRSNPEARWGVYGGIGASAGVTLQSRLSLGMFEFSTTRTNDFFFLEETNDFQNNSHKTEIFEQSTSFGFAFNVPVGVDWRVGKKNKLLQRVHLFYEIRPGIDFHQIPGSKMSNQTKLFQGIGIRYS